MLFAQNALKHLVVACSVNICGGLLYKAVANKLLQFRHSVPLFTNKINCFLLSAVSRLLNCSNSSLPTFEWFSIILSVGILNFLNI
jgi:hypothetical protein